MRPRVGGVTVLVVAAALVVGGCGTPPWQEGATTSPTPSVTATPSPTPTPSAAPVRNDLAAGSAKHKLAAGGLDVSVTYWSTLDLRQWTPSAAKPLNMSATASFRDGSTQDIFLTKLTVNVAVTGPDGPLAGPAPLVDTASVQPGYLVTEPNSYGQVFTIGSVDPKGTSVTLTLDYELLQQSAPKSKTFSKQTASDTMVIPLVP